MTRVNCGGGGEALHRVAAAAPQARVQQLRRVRLAPARRHATLGHWIDAGTHLMRSLLLVAGLGLALALTAHGATGATPAAHAGAPGAQATQPGAAKGNGAGLSTWIVLLD